MRHPDPSPLPSLSPSSSSSLRSLPSTPSGSDVQHPVHDSGTASIAPPALPPRPRSSRVSVPPLVPEQSRPRGAAAGASPPPLPPRPSPPPASTDAVVPPPFSEKSQPQPPRRRQWYPETSLGRILFWSVISLVAAAIIAIVVAVCVVVEGKKSSSSSPTVSNANDNGGNPLPASDGGVTIGKPGDIAQFGNKSTDHFVMTTNRSSFVTRLDPIVNPGAIGSHVHRVHGSSYFTQNLIKSSDAVKLANCTTTVVQDDKSSYWVGQLYYRYPNGTLVGVPLDRTSLYYFLKAPTGVPIYPFPDNYNIVAGDPYRRYFNASVGSQGALWWQCYRGNGNDLMARGFPPSACSGGLVQAVQFCWDGVYANDGDYSTHVTYPSDGTNGYHCPTAFPKKFITIQFETVFAVYDFPFNGVKNITWVLANGDTSGYGIHADFMNGWNPDTLAQVVDDCRYMNSTNGNPNIDDPANCPILNKTIDLGITWSCRSQTPVVNETVGEIIGFDTLAGCNALWTGNVSKPACPAGHIDGGNLVTVQPSVWSEDIGYIA